MLSESEPCKFGNHNDAPSFIDPFAANISVKWTKYIEHAKINQLMQLWTREAYALTRISYNKTLFLYTELAQNLAKKVYKL